MEKFLNFGQPKKEEPKQFILIKYPGIVKNVDKALQTMGGLQLISQSHFNNHSLELSHTPDNPYTSRIMADRKTQDNISSGTLHLVMKVKRKKANPKKMKADFLGLINTVYSFDVMCDFQYLPLKKRNNTEIFEDMIPKLIPTDLSSALSWWEESNALTTPLFLPPYQFSRYLTPSSKILGRETDHTERTRRSVRSGYGQNLRVERKALSVTVLAQDVFPTEPSVEAVAEAQFRCKHDEPHRLLRELFEERPMWTRIGILYRTRIDDNLLRSILQKYAFYIQSGPWGRLWCKFGYDPRTDRGGGRYQTLMVSFRNNGSIPERQRLKVSSDRAPNVNPIADVNELTEPVSYTYEPGKLPRVRQMWYCVIDVRLPRAIEALEEVEEPETPLTEEEIKEKGWLPTSLLDKIRDLIKEDVAKTSVNLEHRMIDTTQRNEEDF
uniref:General transcription factor 3C polypeptide 5 n=1 Tax=Caenorhabditis tropicalis TaxID=1561998 RepID=A0A1I7UMN2_9PELO